MRGKINPVKKNGRPKETVEYQIARDLTKQEIISAISKLFFMTHFELKNHLKNPDIKVNERLIGRVIEKCDENGDHCRLNFLYDRIIGKVSENIAVNGTINVNDILVDALRVHIMQTKELTDES